MSSSIENIPPGEQNDKNIILNQIKEFADRAHGEQMRKYAPERYIAHPIRVMETCRQYTSDVKILAAALLHDVLEDTPVTKEQMQEFLEHLMNKPEAQQIVHLVEELTDIYTKDKYPQWNRHTRKQKEMERLEKTSEEAQTIKYADLIDNTSEIVEKDPDFSRRYLEEAKILLKKLRKGIEALRQRAMATVKENLGRLHNFSL